MAMKIKNNIYAKKHKKVIKQKVLLYFFSLLYLQELFSILFLFFFILLLFCVVFLSAIFVILFSLYVIINMIAM